MLELEQRFTDDAAHELRTPLTAIRTHLQIARRVEGNQHREAMRQAEAGVGRLTKTLDQLLLLARMESEEITRGGLDSTPLEEALETAMTETGSRDRCRYNERVNRIHIALSGALLVIALRNLLGNAVRHGLPGAPIEIEAQESNGMAVINIINQGETIRPEQLARLTERFQRGSHPQGSGLGLSIVDAIVTRAGGRVTFTSGNGVGLRVSLQLPSS
ncbi:sensor histidine kinase [Vreelandella rituensis]